MSSRRQTGRLLPAFAALVLVPGSVLALGQVPVAAAPAAPAAVVPTTATASTSAGLLGLTVADVGLPAPLPRIRAARVDVAPTTGSLGSGTPRVRASSSNLGANALGIDLSGILSQAQQTAPPDHESPTNGPEIATLSAPPIINAGVSTTSAHARLAADGSCPAPGTALSTSTTTTANVSVLDLGAAGSLLKAPGTVSTTQSVELTTIPQGGDSRAVTSTARSNLASLQLLGNVTVGISQAPRMVATASGRPGGASVTYSQPVVTVTAPGVAGSPFVLDQADESVRLGVPGNPLLKLDLSLGALTSQVAPNGTSASGSAALLRVELNLLPIIGNGINVATVDVAPLSAAAGAPAGGISCPAPVVDSDGDGLSDAQEGELGTDPQDSDSDDDGLTDGAEVNTTDTDPLDDDSDDDGLLDGAEVNTHGTDPNDADTDDGGVNDGDEVAATTDPLDGTDDDSDGDGLPNAQEQTLGTNPNDSDSDDDGLTDGAEVNTTDTDPLDDDSDDDGLLDGAEVNTHGTDPNDADTDDGGVNDGTEVNRGTDPLDGTDDDTGPEPGTDTDNDGLTDDQESELGTDPENPDTDGDGLTDGAEVNTHGTDPH